MPSERNVSLCSAEHVAELSSNQRVNSLEDTHIYSSFPRDAGIHVQGYLKVSAHYCNFSSHHTYTVYIYLYILDMENLLYAVYPSILYTSAALSVVLYAMTTCKHLTSSY